MIIAEFQRKTKKKACTLSLTMCLLYVTYWIGYLTQRLNSWGVKSHERESEGGLVQFGCGAFSIGHGDGACAFLGQRSDGRVRAAGVSRPQPRILPQATWRCGARRARCSDSPAFAVLRPSR